ncbi:protein-disulfide reductase DsbD N-terminal domain-containing protein [Janthinobacterium sp. 17J80-10]|uniref:protein-disulfide reductase DsbD N-terminal domain-containing protein n=1 Tax=Janthinobacterium sp. 17J80-10 TaxID=2497863 RepID=UPI0010054089|nr:protein-disulfide reductase DsbD N-terminal domain-containing protein [Janthinobacterium sp. 17J80-10]QAU33326.1 cytochrome C biogenesis protein [Janthinobacterium sp. 17J80-10]
MPKKLFICSLILAGLSAGAFQPAYAQQSSAPNLQKGLGSLFSSPKEEDLLEPDKAFTIKTSFKGPATLVAVLTPANGYYMYKDKIRFTLKDAPGVVIKSVKLPPGEVKNDPTFGRTETYKQPVQAEITLERAPSAKNFTLVAGYQGCHEKLGVCYPPIEKTLKLHLP